MCHLTNRCSQRLTGRVSYLRLMKQLLILAKLALANGGCALSRQTPKIRAARINS